jgi:hypothetical protein
MKVKNKTVQNIITPEKLNHYKELTTKALAIAKQSIIKGQEKEAKEIIDMVENYLSDAKHFENKADFVNAFAALNYAHGWLDSGVRLDVFDVNDDKLFTVK